MKTTVNVKWDEMTYICSWMHTRSEQAVQADQIERGSKFVHWTCPSLKQPRRQVLRRPKSCISSTICTISATVLSPISHSLLAPWIKHVPSKSPIVKSTLLPYSSSRFREKILPVVPWFCDSQHFLWVLTCGDGREDCIHRSLQYTLKVYTYHRLMPQSNGVHDLMWSKVARIRVILDTVSVSE